MVQSENTSFDSMYERIDDILLNAGISGSDAQVEQITIAILDIVGGRCDIVQEQ
jgi:hypothetical protein